jgi:hypothetical protein
MRKLSELEGEQAEWIQPKTFERLYQLIWGKEMLARLYFRSGTGTLATGETAEGIWTFKRVGFLNPRITVRAAGSEEDLAVYQPKFWGDGVLSFKGGPVFAWRPTNFWSTAWAFVAPEETVVIAFQTGVEKERLRDIFKTQFTVTFYQMSTIREAAPLLVTLGLYLLILHQEDAAAAGAIAATSAAV